jgi:hypothetical protein
MGRVKKYDNADEAKQAQKEQIRKSNQKYQAERREFRKQAYNEQLELVRLLNKHVIHDKEFLNGTLMIVQEYIDDNIGGAGEDVGGLVNEKGEAKKDLDVILEEKKESGAEEIIEKEKSESKNESESEKEKGDSTNEKIKPKRKYVRKTKPKNEKENDKDNELNNELTTPD